MATYNLVTALVKYAIEQTTGITYDTSVAFNLNNITKNTVYAKVSIVTQGTYTWTYADGTTEKTYTLNSGATVGFSESLIPSTLPTETDKDSIQLKVEYFKDDAYTQKIGEDIVNVTIYIYIQQADGTWGSTTLGLTDADVVYDRLDNIPALNGATGDILLDNGLAKIWIEYRTGGGWYNTTGVIHDTCIYYTTGSTYKIARISIVDASTNKAFTDKIIAFVHKTYYTTDVTIRDDNNLSWGTIPNAYAWKKIIIPPLGVKPYANLEDHDRKWFLDGIVIFNQF